MEQRSHGSGCIDVEKVIFSVYVERHPDDTEKPADKLPAQVLIVYCENAGTKVFQDANWLQQQALEQVTNRPVRVGRSFRDQVECVSTICPC